MDGELSKLGVGVVGASGDSVRGQKKFAEKEHLPFPLLADAERELCARYGVLQEKSFMGRKYIGIARMTFVIDGEGMVREVFEKVMPIGHAAQVLEAIRALGLAESGRSQATHRGEP